MGSFGITEEMRAAIEESKNKEKGVNKAPEQKVETPAEIISDDFDFEVKKEDVKEVVEEEPKEETLEEKLDREIEELSKLVGIKLTEDDIWSVLYNQQLVKDSISIIKGKFEVSFKLLNSDDNREIDNKVAKFLEGKFLEEGYKNEVTLWLMSFGITKMGKPGETKSIGATAEDRYRVFSGMPVIMLEKLARKWNDFTRLCNATLEKEVNGGNF